MSLLHRQVAWQLALLGWALFVPALAWAGWRLRRGFFPSEAVEHAWYGGALCAALLWLLAIQVGPGPAFGMLGAGLYTLVFGRERALLGLALALGVHTACTHGAWGNLGLNGLLFAVLPAVVASACQRAIERWLPRHLFVFIIGNGMFTCLCTAAVTGLLLLLVAAATDPNRAQVQVLQYLGPLLLLAWSEAIVSGMLFSALVVFRPELVLTYRQDLYLPRRPWAGPRA